MSGFIFLLCVLPLCMLDIYIYIYIYLLLKDGRALCMMDSHGKEGTLLMIIGALDLGVWVCI